MKDVLKPGYRKHLSYTVKQEDTAAFAGEEVHPVCATFTLAREIEWATRQYMFEWRDEDEEGIGTFLSIDHRSPAFVGDELIIESVIESINRNELICAYIVRVNDRVIATGKTGQKVLKREKLRLLLNRPS
jgi:fluoroacetyl-CoA thioesterase